MTRFNPRPGERLDFDEPGHFVCADRCEWVRHTHVGGFCVSSVGELRLVPAGDLWDVGAGRLYETMVFLWDPEANGGKGDGVSGGSVDSFASNDRAAAEANHEAAVELWRQRSWHHGEADWRGERACIPDQPWNV